MVLTPVKCSEIIRGERNMEIEVLSELRIIHILDCILNSLSSLNTHLAVSAISFNVLCSAGVRG